MVDGGGVVAQCRTNIGRERVETRCTMAQSINKITGPPECSAGESISL
jgi:hypothetical protein